MDPVTLIVTALGAGAGSALQDGASEAVKDAYARLKALVKKRFAGRPKAELVLAVRCPGVSGQGSNRISPERDGGNVGGQEPKRYTPEFKEQAAKKVIDYSLPIAQVARELGVNDTTLGFWVKEYRKRIAGDPLPPGMPEAERVKELERRVRELEME